MRKILLSLVVAVATVGLLAQTADAASRKRARVVVHPPAPARVDPAVATSGVVVGAGATAGYFAFNGFRWNHWNTARAGGVTSAGAYGITSVGCAAVAPIFATAVVNRPLTAREANTLVVGCFVPIIGPLVLNAIYDSHPEWF